MSTIVDKQIADAEKKLTALLRDVDQEVFARVQAWVVKMANGLKLSEFLYADDQWPVEHRVTVVRSLIDILEAKDYARLPEAEKAKPKARIGVTISAPHENHVHGNISLSGERAQNHFEESHISDVKYDGLRPPEDEGGDEHFDPPPAPDEQRELVRQEVRLQLASILETIAKVLRDSK